MRRRWTMLALATGIMLGPAALPPASEAALPEVWEGVWAASTGVRITFKQNGNQVFGTYTGNKGGNIQGTASGPNGGVLKGTYQGRPNGGVFKVFLGSDGVTFSGTYTQCKWRIWGRYLRCPDGDTKRWSGEKL